MKNFILNITNPVTALKFPKVAILLVLSIIVLYTSYKPLAVLFLAITELVLYLGYTIRKEGNIKVQYIQLWLVIVTGILIYATSLL